MRFSIAALVFLCLSTAAAAAEPDSISLKQGDRVRVMAAGVRGDFVLEDVDAVSLWLSDPDGVAQPRVLLDDISSLAVRVERSSGWGAGRGALLGAAGGLVVGLIAAAVVVATDTSEGSMVWDDEIVFALLGADGVLLGTLIGALVGAIHPGGRWESIPLDGRFGAGASPNGTIGLEITVPIGGS